MAPAEELPTLLPPLPAPAAAPAGVPAPQAVGVIIPQAVGAPNLPQLPAQPPTGAGPRRQPPRDWPQSRTISDLETLWEVPASPKGVLFVAHGCNHAATDWWPASPRCPTCVGLPEERIIRKAALRRGYAVVAVSSFDRDTQCWHNTGSPADSDDLQRLPDVLKAVVKEEGLGSLPLYAFGASSGGGIVLRLAEIMAEVQVGRRGVSRSFRGVGAAHTGRVAGLLKRKAGLGQWLKAGGVQPVGKPVGEPGCGLHRSGGSARWLLLPSPHSLCTQLVGTIPAVLHLPACWA